MDARALAAAALLAALCPAVAISATFRTENFVVTAPTPEFAKKVGEAAEFYRHHVAVAWLGEPLPGRWSQPCPVKCKVGPMGAGGATTFTFQRGSSGQMEVFGWNMDIQGTEQRILDSVLPHEISHMIFACHFRRPLPRWADEGAATLIEHESERMRQTKLLNQVINTSKRIPLQRLLSIKEYPRDMRDVLTLYAEGYSLADYLVQKKGEEGRATFLTFLGDALKGDSLKHWEYAFEKHYGIPSLQNVEQEWTEWVMAGSPTLDVADGVQLADAETGSSNETPADQTEFRGQSPDANRVVKNPNPLPRLSRPRREPAAASDLSAPQPGTLTAQTSNPGGWVGIPTEGDPNRPISVHPARPAGPESAPRWRFPWQTRGESEDPRPGSQRGFSDPRTSPGTATQSQFDFSR